jgi:hypothetical protein
MDDSPRTSLDALRRMIVTVAGEHEVTVEPFEPVEAFALRADLARRHAIDAVLPIEWRLLSHLRDRSYSRFGGYWKDLALLVGHHRATLVVEVAGSVAAFGLADGARAADLLATVAAEWLDEGHEDPFDAYPTDREGAYVVGVEQSGYLVAAGLAKRWATDVTPTAEILRAIHLEGVSARQLDAHEAAWFRTELSKRYAGGSGGWLWASLTQPAASIQLETPEAPTWVAALVQGRRVLVLVDENRDLGVFEFADGGELGPVLGECGLFEFYVTDRALSFFLCVNHHDFLIAAGEALNWLEARKAGLA